MSKKDTSTNIELHVETREEIKIATEPILKRADFNFVYNEYIKKYEDEHSTKEETALINFYKLSDFIKSNKSKSISKIYEDWFSSAAENGSLSSDTNYLTNITNYDLSVINKLPFFVNIKFDRIETDTQIDNFFITNRIKQRVLEEIANKISYTINISDYNLDPPAFSKYNSLISKNTQSVIAYKILKQSNSETIQEWYISDNSDVINFIDTQVIYEKEYNYILYLIVASIAEKEIKVETVESTRYSNKIVSNPPMPPTVFMTPVDGEPDKIKIFLNGSIGKMLLEPVFIEDDDKNQNKRLQIYTGDKIAFVSEVQTKTFEMYKLNYEPTDLSDFKENKISLETDTYDDILEYNIKYYYLFRTVDVHDGTSNPTQIYTVFLNYDNGTVFPVFGIYNIKEAQQIQRKNLEDSSKQFKRYFSIYPSSIQTIGNPEKGQIWGKKFKIRLTSISTGKKIDFNIKYISNEEN